MGEGKPPAETPEVLVAVCILNWQGWRDTLRALESVQQLAYPNYLMVVADNGSEDESVAKICAWARGNLGPGGVLLEYDRASALSGGTEEEAECEAAPSRNRLVLIRNGENLGYAEGNNIAIHYALRRSSPAEYVFLLNSDALADRDCLTRLVSVARQTGAGVVGATVLDEDGQHAQFNGRTTLVRQFFSPYVKWQQPPPATDDDFWTSCFAVGAALLVRKEALEAVQSLAGEYLDSGLFLYGEELSLCCTALKAGYSTVVARRAVVRHGKAQSSGGSFNPITYYYPERNIIRQAHQFLPLSWLILFHLVYFPTSALRIGKNLIWRRPHAARAILAGLADGYRSVTGKWKRHDEEVRRFRERRA